MALEKLVYILGSGRSGSTLVERVLHTSPDIASVGEFHCLWRLAREEITCSCATRFSEDDFWHAVIDTAGITPADIAELARLEALVSRSGFIARHGYSLDRLRENADVQRFVAMNFRIFETVAQLSGTRVVVDSSKAGPRAWILATDPRVSVLHLYRSPGDVMASWRARKFDQGLGQAMSRLSVPKAAMDWAKPEHFARRLRGKATIHSMNYADLAEQPVPSVARALTALGLDGYEPPRWIDERRFRDRDGYHSLNGNPDRFSRTEITIAPRAVNRDFLDLSDRMLIPLSAGLLKLAYPMASEHRA